MFKKIKTYFLIELCDFYIARSHYYKKLTDRYLKKRQEVLSKAKKIIYDLKLDWS